MGNTNSKIAKIAKMVYLRNNPIHLHSPMSGDMIKVCFEFPIPQFVWAYVKATSNNFSLCYLANDIIRYGCPAGMSFFIGRQHIQYIEFSYREKSPEQKKELQNFYDRLNVGKGEMKTHNLI